MTSHSLSVNGVAAPALEGRSFEIYQWPLPTFIGPNLERLYHSTFCTLPHLLIWGSIGPFTQAWVERRSGQITALLLFDASHGCARIINEVIDLDPGTLNYFAKTVFRHLDGITAIALHAVAVSAPSMPFYFQSAVFSEDFVLDLPGSEAAYLASLTRQTREKIRYYQARCHRKQPSFSFRLAHGANIDVADIEIVMQFNRARMANKGRQFAMDDIEQQSLQRLICEHGLIAVIEIDAQVRAGLLCTQTGRDIYMHVIAHDPIHDDLNLGFICCYLGIRAAIDQGCTRFHFLWGRSDYKLRFGARPKALLSIALYKSRLHVLLHPQLFFGQLNKAILQSVKKWRQHWQVRRNRQSRNENAAKCVAR